MTPIEAMARALSKALNGYESEPDEIELDAARAAIDALADNVSAGMKSAGHDAVADQADDLYGTTWSSFAGNIFTAMLKAAREE